MNVRDSKKLSPGKREAMAPEIEKLATWELLVIPAEEIDLMRAEMSLNDFEAKLFAQLIERLHPETAYVDAADVDAIEFKRCVQRELPFAVEVASDPALRAELVGLRKTVLIELKDGTKYHFTLAGQKVEGLIDGGVDPADITIATDADTLRGLILREIGPFKAYATGKIKLKGTLEDLARFRKFF